MLQLLCFYFSDTSVVLQEVGSAKQQEEEFSSFSKHKSCLAVGLLI